MRNFLRKSSVLIILCLLFSNYSYAVGTIYMTGAGGNDSSTMYLLSFDGADAATSTTDSSTGKTEAHPATFGGDAQLDTAQKKFGPSSLLLDGTGDYITFPDSSDASFAASNFTIDCWIRRNDTGSLQFIVAKSDETGAGSAATKEWTFRINADDTLRFQISDGSTQPYANSTGTITSTTSWVHVAFVRYGNTGTLYINGNADGTVDLTGFTSWNSAWNMTIGRYGARELYYFNGWIDEFRVSKGSARWTTNFSVYTRPYDNVGTGDGSATLGN